MTYSAQLAAQHGFGTGDRVVVPKSGFNIIAHHAMFYGYGHNGEALVAENKEGRGVILRPLDQFLAEAKKIKRHIPFVGSYQERVALLERVHSRLGRQYDLWNYNCEHFVNDVKHRRVFSRQIQIFIGCAIAIVLVVVFVLPKLLKRK